MGGNKAEGGKGGGKKAEGGKGGGYKAEGGKGGGNKAGGDDPEVEEGSGMLFNFLSLLRAKGPGWCS